MAVPTWQCDVCLRRFVAKNSMRAHQHIVHDGAREQRCELCRQAFATRSQLVTHVRKVHADAEPTAAAIAARRADDARVNRRLAQRGRTAACALCAKAFYDAAQLRRHVTKAHGSANVVVGSDEQGLPATGDMVDADYYCPLCSASYDDDHNTCIACEECERFFHACCDHVVDVSVYDDDTPGALMYVCTLCCQEADDEDRELGAAASNSKRLPSQRSAAAAAAADVTPDGDLRAHAIAVQSRARRDPDPSAAGPFAEPASAANYAGLEAFFPLDLIAAADVELGFASIESDPTAPRAQNAKQETLSF